MALSEVYWDHQIPLPKLAPVQAKVTVALVALLCFINSYDGEFVFDDSEAIVNNKVCFLFLLVCDIHIQYIYFAKTIHVLQGRRKKGHFMTSPLQHQQSDGVLHVGGVVVSLMLCFCSRT